MRFWPFHREQRSRLTSTSDRVSFQVLDWNAFYRAAMGEDWDWGTSLTADDAMKVSPVSAGVNFLANAIASLPMRLYERQEPDKDGKPERKEIRGGMLDDVLNHYWNDDEDAVTGRTWMIQQMLRHGVCYIYVERNLRGRILQLIPLHHSTIRVEWRNGKKRYFYNPNSHQKGPSTNRATKIWETRDIIEVGYRYRDDRITPVSMLDDAAAAIAVYRALEAYGAKFFGGGGVPPLAVYVPASTTEEAAVRMKTDVASAVMNVNRSGELIIALPYGHEVKPIGVDPEKAQMIEAKKYQLTELARYMNLSPIFLQDLTHGTFNNTEQQILFVVKNTLRPLAYKIDRRFNLSLFGRGDNRFVNTDMTELLRGDTATRFRAWATGVQGAIMTPNEARSRENLPPLDEPDAGKLHLQQGTTVLGGEDNDPALDRLNPMTDDNSEGDEDDASDDARN